MTLPPFKLEEYLAKHEFKAPYLLCCSDAESFSLQEILSLADAEMKEKWQELRLGYTEVTGLPLLRKEIARLYTTIASDDVCTTVGAEEAIYCAIQSLVEPGDHVIVVEPCYQSHKTLPVSRGADVTILQLDPQKKWKLGLEEVKRAFRPNTKMVILNDPHNPTGALLEKKVFNGLIELARKSGAYILNDEVYRFMERDERKRLPSIVDAYEKGLSVNVMTKAFGLAGLRIGWLATRDQKALQKVASYKHYTSICNSGPSELLAVIALRAKEKLLQRNREILSSNFLLFDAFMKRHDKTFSWIPPEGGPVALVELKLPVSVELFAEKVLEKSGILLMPGSCFDLPGNYFRVGLGRVNMPFVLDRFEQFLSIYHPVKKRCFGGKSGQEFYAEYHDKEWGRPVHDDRQLFEMLILEGAQAGLSWETILKRREGYRKAFHNFDPVKVAAMKEDELDALLQEEGIIRNRLKVYAARTNAKVFLRIQKEFGSFDAYLWKFVEGTPIRNHRKSLKDVPATTKESDALSKDLKKRGMTFVGSTIIYAFMQAVGLVNDHLEDCHLIKNCTISHSELLNPRGEGEVFVES